MRREAAPRDARRPGAARDLPRRARASPRPLSGASAHRVGQLVDTHVVFAGGAAALACVPAGARIEFVSLSRRLSAPVTWGSTDDQPEPFRRAPEPVPPLGTLLGVPLSMDEAVSQLVVFRAFSPGDFVEVPYDDLVRMERPTLVGCTFAGVLEAGGRPPLHARAERARP